VPISRRARVLNYLGSTPNLVGCGFGVIALVIIAISGLGGILWLALILLAYAAGAVIGQLMSPDHSTPTEASPRRAAR
jgi:hypothetical protein